MTSMQTIDINDIHEVVDFVHSYNEYIHGKNFFDDSLSGEEYESYLRASDGIDAAMKAAERIERTAETCEALGLQTIIGD